MRLALRLYGDPVLKTPARPVAAIDDNIRRLAADMIETMRAENGIGLAAQQVGADVAVCVVDVPPEMEPSDRKPAAGARPPMPLVLINPRIVAQSDAVESSEEGCLSFPDIRAPVSRPVEVTVRWLGLDGQEREARWGGLLARCVQHEMDHLAGLLISDRMSPVKRIALAGRLKRLRRETEAALARA